MYKIQVYAGTCTYQLQLYAYTFLVQVFTVMCTGIYQVQLYTGTYKVQVYAGMCKCQVNLYMDVYKVQVYAGKNMYILYIALYCGNGYVSQRCRGNIITRIEITTKYMCTIYIRYSTRWCWVPFCVGESY